jgi:hypothetical protein
MPWWGNNGGAAVADIFANAFKDAGGGWANSVRKGSKGPFFAWGTTIKPLEITVTQGGKFECFDWSRFITTRCDPCTIVTSVGNFASECINDPKVVIDPARLVVLYSAYDSRREDVPYQEFTSDLDDSFTWGSGPTPFPATAEVPAPLPLFGAAAAFGFSRKLRKRIKLAPAALGSALA